MCEKDQRDRIINRIKKCLRLSESNEPHEAAAALRQAQKLMSFHGLSEDDIELSTVDLVIWRSEQTTGMREKMPVPFSMLVSVIQKAFGVEVVMSYHQPRIDVLFAVHYFGIDGRATLAEFASQVVWKAMHASWQEHSEVLIAECIDNASDMTTGADVVSRDDKVAVIKDSFLSGWLWQVKEKIDTFARGPIEQKLIEKKIAEQFPDSLEKGESEKPQLDDGAFGAGMIAAGDFSLNRPMTGRRQRAISHRK